MVLTSNLVHNIVYKLTINSQQLTSEAELWVVISKFDMKAPFY